MSITAISSKIDAYILANNLNKELKESLSALVSECVGPLAKTIAKDLVKKSSDKPKKEVAEKKEPRMCESTTKKGLICKCKALEQYGDKWLCYRHLKSSIQNESD